MTTIADLVVNASLNPQGIRTGLDQAQGYVKAWSAVATDALRAATTSATSGPAEAAKTYLDTLKRSFAAGQAALRQNLFIGALSPEAYAQQAAQNAQAYNLAISAGIQKFRNGGFTDAEVRPLIDAYSDAGRRAGEAFATAQSQATRQITDSTRQMTLLQMQAIEMNEQMGASAEMGATRSVAGLGRIRMGLTSLVAQMSGTLPVLDRVGGTLLTFAAGESLALGVVAGLAAIGGAWMYLTKDTREAEKANEDAIKSLREFLKLDAQKRAGGQTAPGAEAAAVAARRAQEEIDKVTQRLGRSNIGDLRRKQLQAQLDDAVALRDKLTRESAAGEAEADRQRKANIASLDDSEARALASRLKFSQQDADARRQTLALLARDQAEYKRLLLLPYSEDTSAQIANVAGRIKEEQEALNPKQKNAGRDRGPFADLKDQVGELTTAYENMQKMGIQPSLALQTQLEAAFERTGHLLAALPDQTSAAANALRAIQQDILNSGIHANDALLAGGTSPKIGFPTGEADQRASDATARVALLRDALGEMDSDVAAAEANLSRMLDAVNLQIEREGGALHASNDLLLARQTLTRELADESASRSKDLWGSEDTMALTEQIKRDMGQLKGVLRGNNDEWAAMREGIQGVIDAASGLGLVNAGVRDIAGGATHLISALQEVQRVQKARAAAEAAGSAGAAGGAVSGLLGTVSTISAGLGVIGAGISIATGIMSLFSHHDATLERNNARLDALREAMIDTGGVGGQRKALETITAWADARQKQGGPILGVDPFAGRSSNGNEGLDAALAKAGISVDQFDKMAKDLGIEIGTGMEWIKAFAAALKLATEAETKYTNSLSDQTALVDLHNKVFGTTGAADELKSTIALLTQFAPQLGSVLGDISTTTDEGRAKLREALKNFVTMIEQGTITPEMLGSLTGIKDFAALILKASDSLDALGATTDKLNSAMSANIPTWYKVNAARYGAADPGERGTTPATPPAWATPQPLRPPLTPMNPDGRLAPPFTPSAPTPPRSPLSPIGQVPSLDSSSGSGAVIIYGDVNVDAKSYTPDEMFKAVRQVGQRQAQLKFGTTKRWGEV